MRPRVLHAVRDSRGDGEGLRSVPGAGLLLSPPARRGAGRRPPARPEWWTSYFDARYLREYEPLLSLESDRRDVARVIDLLGLPVGSRVLDVPCGQGRHAHLLAEAGYRVDALDYSAHLLHVARRRGFGPELRYRRGDMRQLPRSWSGRFDAVLNLFTSFGFFLDPSDDARVLAELARVLRPGGTLLWHGASRDGVMARFLERDWWQLADGTLVAHERDFDPLSGVLTVRATSGSHARRRTRDHRIRLYTATRLAELCAAVGLVVEEAYDGWNARPLTRRSSEMLLVARRRELPRPRAQA